MSYLKTRSPLAKAKNLGASGGGTHHWWHQRLTSVIMLILLPWLFYVIHSISGKETSAVLENLHEPYNIIPIMLFLITAFYHAGLGMRVVIEDYIPNLCVRYTLIVIIQIFTIVTILSAVLALLSLMML
ncbi:MAG: succinate dehydrogenase, hydrophobic membrane anchor protein [Pseudomonadota bacterium]